MFNDNIKLNLRFFECFCNNIEAEEEILESMRHESDVIYYVLENKNPDPVNTGTRAENKANNPTVKNVVKKSINVGSTLVKNCIKFIGELVTKFINMVNKLYVENTKWLEKKIKNIDKIDFSKLEVQMDPNYLKSEKLTMGVQSLPMVLTLTNPNIINDNYIKSRFKIDPVTTQGIRLEQFMQSGVFDKFLDQQGSLAQGTKNYFMYGKGNYTNAQKTLYKGDGLKNLCIASYNYCKSYPDTSKKLKDFANFVSKSLSTIERKMQTEASKSPVNNDNMTTPPVSGGSRPVGETFLLVEDCLLQESTLSNLTNFEAILEAVDIKTGNTPTNQNKPNDNSKKVPDNNNNGISGNKNDTRLMKETVRSTQGLKLQILKYVVQCLQIIITSALTCHEQRYFSYLKILKYGLSEKNMTQAYMDNPNDVVK